MPVFGSTAVITSVKKPNATKVNWDVNLFPNPSDGQFSLFINKNGKYLANIYNMIGEKVWSREITEQHLFELKDFAKGQYLMELIDVKDADQKVTKSFTIN